MGCCVWTLVKFLEPPKTKKNASQIQQPKKRKTLKPLAGLLRRQSKRKMEERPLLERKRKCKLREQLTGKRRLTKLSANKNLAKCIHVTTIGPLLRIHLRTRMGIFKKKLN